MAETASRLAAQGLVVFAPTYRTDMSTEQGMADLASDVTCAYRYAIANADRYNGDLDQPITIAGWSLGATFALEGGLTNEEPPIVVRSRSTSCPRSWSPSLGVITNSREIDSTSTPLTGETRMHRCS